MSRGREHIKGGGGGFIGFLRNEQRVWGIFWLYNIAGCRQGNSSLWKLFSSFMESYAFIFGRRKTTASCYWLLYVPCGERTTGGLIYHKKVGILILIICQGTKRLCWPLHPFLLTMPTEGSKSQKKDLKFSTNTKTMTMPFQNLFRYSSLLLQDEFKKSQNAPELYWDITNKTVSR